MAQTDAPITEAEILTQVIAPDKPGLPGEVARAILDLRFNRSAVDRMHELAERNNLGTLTGAEHEELEKYVRVGSFLDLIQAKARLSLKNLGSSA
jgi:uncharacterized protein YnzC (UPF0291/DUF896 family)